VFEVASSDLRRRVLRRLNGPDIRPDQRETKRNQPEIDDRHKTDDPEHDEDESAQGD